MPAKSSSSMDCQRVSGNAIWSPKSRHHIKSAVPDISYEEVWLDVSYML